MLRTHKKIGKASIRLDKANNEMDRLTNDDNISMEELQNCPNIDEIELQYKELKNRLSKINELNELLSKIKNKKQPIELPENIAKLAIELQIDDTPPTKQKRGPGKKKGPKVMESYRKPYRRYYSFDNVEIRVS